MPDDPDVVSYDAATPSGVLPVHDLSAGDDSVFYQVVWLDLPAYLADSAAPESFLGEAGRWGGEGGIALPDSTLSLKDHPGRAFLAREPDGSLRKVQLYAEGERLYQLVVRGPAAAVAGSRGDRFFTSFSIDN